MEAPTKRHWAVMIRTATGHEEILPEVYDAEVTAFLMADFWRSHYRGGSPVETEVVMIERAVRKVGAAEGME